MMTWRDYAILGGIALVAGIFLLLSIEEPGYTDAYYYYNAGERLADGDGLTDPYVFIYLNAPDSLPGPSHTYWMPLTSILAAGSMATFGTSFTAAQLPSLMLLVLLVMFTGWLGTSLGERKRYGYLAGLLVLGGGYYLPFWLNTDAFALYGLVGAAALVTTGRGISKSNWRWFILTGVLTGLAHLTRADGLLFGIVALMLIWWPWRLEKDDESAVLNRGLASISVIVAYLLTMLPWFVRNLNEINSPLPTGGTGTAFLRGYNELFAYPVDWSLSNFLGWGISNIIDSRMEALFINGATWLAVEGLVLVGPLALWTLFKYHRRPVLTAFWLYALGLHTAMTLVFAYPGYRGGLLHSSVALFPFWMTLGAMGMDAGIEKLATWRNWNTSQAQMVFGVALVLMSVFIGISFSRLQSATQEGSATYETVAADYLPDDAVLMVNSPPTWYYFTDLFSVALPDAPLERLPEIVEKYCVTHLVLDVNVTDSFKPLIEGTAPPPDFLEEIAHLDRGTEEIEDDVRVYRFNLTCSP